MKKPEEMTLDELEAKAAIYERLLDLHIEDNSSNLEFIVRQYGEILAEIRRRKNYEIY